MEIKKIVMGSDHAGYNLKLKIKAHLESRGIEVLDVGTNSPESCNYTVFAHAVCEAVTDGMAPLGILVCGTGSADINASLDVEKYPSSLKSANGYLTLKAALERKFIIRP